MCHMMKLPDEDVNLAYILSDFFHSTQLESYYFLLFMPVGPSPTLETMAFLIVQSLYLPLQLYHQI